MHKTRQHQKRGTTQNSGITKRVFPALLDRKPRDPNGTEDKHKPDVGNSARVTAAINAKHKKVDEASNEQHDQGRAKRYRRIIRNGLMSPFFRHLLVPQNANA